MLLRQLRKNYVSLEYGMSKRDGQVQHPKLLEKRENIKILDHEKSVFHAARWKEGKTFGYLHPRFLPKKSPKPKFHYLVSTILNLHAKQFSKSEKVEKLDVMFWWLWTSLITKIMGAWSKSVQSKIISYPNFGTNRSKHWNYYLMLSEKISGFPSCLSRTIMSLLLYLTLIYNLEKVISFQRRPLTIWDL